MEKRQYYNINKSGSLPTLLLASSQDNIIPVERSEHMARHIKHSELIYLEECGHIAPLEKPVLLNNILSG